MTPTGACAPPAGVVVVAGGVTGVVVVAGVVVAVEVAGVVVGTAAPAAASSNIETIAAATRVRRTTLVAASARACCAATPTDGLFANRDGHIRDGLYTVGWAKRGPSGTIPTNRIEAQAVAQRIAADLRDGEKPGGAGLRTLLDG